MSWWKKTERTPVEDDKPDSKCTPGEWFIQADLTRKEVVLQIANPRKGWQCNTAFDPGAARELAAQLRRACDAIEPPAPPVEEKAP